MKFLHKVSFCDTDAENEITIDSAEDLETCNIKIKETERPEKGIRSSLYFSKEELGNVIQILKNFHDMM